MLVFCSELAKSVIKYPTTAQTPRYTQPSFRINELQVFRVQKLLYFTMSWIHDGIFNNNVFYFKLTTDLTSSLHKFWKSTNIW